MDRETARQEIRREWRQLIPFIAQPAKTRVNGETSWICPICGHGKSGDGLTFDPTSRDGNGLKCFGCGFSGDVIDLYQQTTGADHNTAFSSLAAQLGLEIDPQQGRTPAGADFQRETSRRNATRNDPSRSNNTNTPGDGKTQQEANKRPTEAATDFSAYYDACAERLTDPAAAQYLQKRGISIETARRHFIGFDPQADPASAPGAMGESYRPHPCPRIIIPISVNNYTARSIDPKTPAQWRKINPKGQHMGIFNLNKLYAHPAQEVFITEGAFDALSIAEAGGSAIALNSASLARQFIEKLEKKRPAVDVFIIARDNDAAGQAAADIISAGLERLKIPFIAADINGGCKDPNEALTADRAAFTQAVAAAQEAARDKLDAIRAAAERENQERQQRTGAAMVDAFLETIRSHKYEPIPTGITDIDRALGGGFMRQWLVLLGAAPGAGKTALAQWIFEGMAKRGQSVLFLNLEMSREQILARSISRIAAQKGHKIKPIEILQGYRWNSEQEAIVSIALNAYKRDIAPHMIYNPDGVTANLDSILEYLDAEASRAQEAGQPAPLVCLDYLQIVTGREREDDAAIIKRAVSGLKNYAIRNNTTVFVIIAHNRAANSSGNVTMESGRDTSALEYSADLQLGLAFTKCLKRDGKPGKSLDDLTPEERQHITLKVTKGRFTPPGVEVDLIFNGETMTYSQTAKEFEAQEPPPARRADYRL